MGEKTKKCLSFLLAFVLAMGLCPVVGVADDGLELEPELGSESGPGVESTFGVETTPVVQTAPVVQGEKLSTESLEGDGAVLAAQSDVSNVDYVYYADEAAAIRGTTSSGSHTCTKVESGTTSWTSGDTNGGWYVVDSEVEISNLINVSGNVHLILADGAKLTASMGIRVTEASLTIYGQDEGTGKLFATGCIYQDGGYDYHQAGIGGWYKTQGTSDVHLASGSCKKVTINGGEITVKGNDGGAGIGWGDGTVIINGGEVTATGGKNGAAIGGGHKNDGCTVTVNGGEVTATGGENGAGIGGGYEGSGGKVTVNGGEVTATGGEGAMGIGAGKESSKNGTLTLAKGVQMETSVDNERWADTTSTPDVRTRYMKTYPHVHNWAYSASGAILSAECGNGGCPIETKPTLTLEAPTLKVEGGEGSAKATLVPNDTWTEENGLKPASEIEVLYYSGQTTLDKAPTTAGSYKAATREIRDVMPSAEVSYTIAKKTEPTPTPAILTFDLDGGRLGERTGTVAVESAVGSTAKLLDAPARDGYTFRCWKDVGGKEYAAGAGYEVKGDHAFKAEWTEDKKPDPDPDPEPTPTPTPVPSSISVTYAGHAQDVGDLPAVKDGATLGTVGQARRLEQFTASVSGVDGASISYRAHLQDTGWGDWTKDGGRCGTTGEARRIEAVQMTLSGASGHHVWYRVHSENYGWLGWAKDGQPAGTAGQGLRVEALEVRVLPEGADPARELRDYVEGQASYVGAATGEAHVQNVGWTGTRSAMELGTTGRGLRLEALRLSSGSHPISGGIEYDVHVQDTGWVDGSRDGAVAGTVGRARRIEAVRISLTGELEDSGAYSVWYRVHAQDYGWLGWAHDGAEAGTTGLARRAEAIDVQVLPSGQHPSGYDAGQAACVTS